jgi:hypothetical protein
MVEFLCAMNVGVLICLGYCMCDARDTCLSAVKRVKLLMSSTNSETLYFDEGIALLSTCVVENKVIITTPSDHF